MYLHHTEALHLARQGKFYTTELVNSVSKTETEWRNKLVTAQAIEAYKYIAGVPNDFQTFSNICLTESFEKQRAAVLTNLAIVYRSEAVDILKEAEKHYNLPETGLIIKLNQSLYLKSVELLNEVIRQCSNMYILAQATVIKGILTRNSYLIEKGLEFLWQQKYVMDILWLKREIKYINNKNIFKKQ